MKDEQQELVALVDVAVQDGAAILARFAHYKGRRVVLKTGRHRGREAAIDDMMLCRTYGIVFLCMVYRRHENEFLNGDAQTRTYWPVDKFRLV